MINDFSRLTRTVKSRGRNGKSIQGVKGRKVMGDRDEPECKNMSLIKDGGIGLCG